MYIKCYKTLLPFSNSNSSHQVSRVTGLLACEQGLLVRELIQLGLEVDVSLVNSHIGVKLSSREPRACKVTREAAARRHHLCPVHS